MGIVSHVGCDESPLGQCHVLDVILECVKALDQLQTCLVLGDRVVKDEGVVLADVVVGKRLLVGEVETLETRVREGFLILGPGDTLGIQKINDGGYIGRDCMEVIVVHAKGLTTSGRAVVGFGRVGRCPVVRQGDPLCGKRLLVWVAAGSAVVLGVIYQQRAMGQQHLRSYGILEPYLVEPVECNALHIA